ncbi:MAG TPA: hypothetical protein VLM18_11360 [Croceibacterium sp.]|nr:hypothetical protein [Croceibacterium sp.]
MPTRADEVDTEADEVRAGSTPHIVRWVLAISLLAAIVLLTAIWVIGAGSSDQNNQSVNAEIHAAQANASDSNNAVASDHADQSNAATPGEGQEPQNMPNKKSGK